MQSQNLLPKLIAAQTKIEVMQLKPSIARLRTIVKQLKGLGLDVGCLDESVEEYALTPRSFDVERAMLFNRILSNIANMIEDYKADWEYEHNDPCENKQDCPAYSKWLDIQRKLYSTPSDKDTIYYNFYRLSENEYITFDNEAIQLAKRFGLRLEDYKGHVAVKLTYVQFNQASRSASCGVVD